MRISALIAAATYVLFNYHTTTANWSWQEVPVEITPTGDSVEILLADNDREQNVSGAFSVMSTGLYQFSITSSAQVKFELQGRNNDNKAVVIVPATTKNTLQIRLLEGRSYTYTLIAPIQNVSSECIIKWTALERSR